MNYLIDIIILSVIALFSFIGYKRGLIKVAFKLISFFLAIFLAIILYKPLSNLVINHTSIDDNLSQSISERLDKKDLTKEEEKNIISNYYSNIKHASIIVISDNIAIAIIKVACILIVFIISKIILLFFKFSGDLIAKLPLIKQCNSAGGFIYGLLQSFLIIYIFFAIIAVLAPVVDINEFIKLINSSIIANIIYNNNIILILFT